MDEARGVFRVRGERDPATVGADHRINIGPSGTGGAEKRGGLVAEAVLAHHRGGEVGGGVEGAAVAHVTVHHEDVHRAVGVGGGGPAVAITRREIIGERGEGDVTAGGTDTGVDAAELLRRRGGRIGGLGTGGGDADAGDRARDAVVDKNIGHGIGIGARGDEIAGLGAESHMATIGGDARSHPRVTIERGSTAGAVAGGGGAEGRESRRGVRNIAQVDIAKTATDRAAEVGRVRSEGDKLAIRADGGLEAVAVARGGGAGGLRNENGRNIPRSVVGAGVRHVAVAKVNMRHADGGAGDDEVGGGRFPSDVATGDADGGFEVGAVALDAGGRHAHAGDDAGEDIDDVDVRKAVGVVEGKIGRIGGEGHVGAVGRDGGNGGVVGGAVGLCALLRDAEATGGRGLVVVDKHITDRVGVSGDERRGVGDIGGVASVGGDRRVVAVTVTRSGGPVDRGEICRQQTDPRRIGVGAVVDVITVVGQVIFDRLGDAGQSVDLGHHIVGTGEVTGKNLIPADRGVGVVGVERETARSGDLMRSQQKIVGVAKGGIAREDDLDAEGSRVAVGARDVGDVVQTIAARTIGVAERHRNHVATAVGGAGRIGEPGDCEVGGARDGEHLGGREGTRGRAARASSSQHDARIVGTSLRGDGRDRKYPGKRALTAGARDNRLGGKSDGVRRDRGPRDAVGKHDGSRDRPARKHIVRRGRGTGIRRRNGESDRFSGRGRRGGCGHAGGDHDGGCLSRDTREEREGGAEEEAEERFHGRHLVVGLSGGLARETVTSFRLGPIAGLRNS